MFKKANINWNAKQVAKMMDKNNIRTNNVVQRGYVWDKKRKSLLVHSMLVGFPMGPIFAVKDDGFYDVLDGKQRLTTIQEFRNDGFELSEIPDVELETEGIANLTGMKYSEMPEEARDLFDSYSLTVYYFDELTDEDINEMFFRLNNNVPLSAIELTRVKAKSITMIREIAQHELFTSAMTKAALAKYANEDIVMKSYALLQSTETDLSTKTVRSLMEEAEWTEEDKDQLNHIYNILLKAFVEIKDKKAKKKVITRIHMISLVPVIEDALCSGVNEDSIIHWIEKFFTTKDKAASISERYNEYVGSGSARKEAVIARYEEMKKSLDETLKEEIK